MFVKAHRRTHVASKETLFDLADKVTPGITVKSYKSVSSRFAYLPETYKVFLDLHDTIAELYINSGEEIPESESELQVSVQECYPRMSLDCAQLRFISHLYPGYWYRV